MQFSGFIGIQKKSAAFPAPIFTKIKKCPTALMVDLNRKANVESGDAKYVRRYARIS